MQMLFRYFVLSFPSELPGPADAVLASAFALIPLPDDSVGLLCPAVVCPSVLGVFC